MLLPVLLPLAACTGEALLPPGRRGARAAIGSGELWTVGGETPAGLSAQVWSYTLDDQTWRRHPDAPVAMAWGAMAWDGAAFVVLAGETEDGVSDRAWRLDPRADAWAPLAPMPVPRARPGSTLVGDTLYLTGGVGPAGEAYGDGWTLRQGVWTQLTADLGVSGFADATLMGGDAGVYQVGGTVSIVEDDLYALVEPWHLQRLDYGRGVLPGACGMVDGDALWLWEGTEEGTTLSWVGTWVDQGDGTGPEPRGWPACAQVGDALYVLGGDPSFGADGGPFRKDLWRLKGGVWKEVLDEDGVPVDD